MNPVSSPSASALFPSGLSPTERLLLSNAPPAALFAALEGGILDATHALRVDTTGKPALFLWARSERKFRNGLSGAWNQAHPWPTTGEGGWEDVRLDEDLSAHAATSLSVQGEWMMGWFLAHGPDGLGRLRWASEDGEGASFEAMVSILVANNWERALQQALRRADAPTGRELDRLLCAQPMYTRLGTSNGKIVRDHIRLPLLHAALENETLSVAERLLEAGADPNALSEDGTPAFFRARKPEALQLLAKYGARLDRTASHGIMSSQWWIEVNGSSASAKPLIDATNKWMQENLSADDLLKTKMPDLAQTLAKGTLTGLKTQIAQLKVPAHIEWEEAGQTWTWARRALALLLESKPVSGVGAPSWQWAIQRPGLGDPLIAGVPNADLLWLVGHACPAAQEAWEKGHAKGQWDSPALSRERIMALAVGLAAPISQHWAPVSPYANVKPPVTRQAWAFPLGRAVLEQPGAAAQPADARHPVFLAWSRLPTYQDMAFDEGVSDALTPVMDQFWQRLQSGRHEEAGRWLGEAVVIASLMRSTHLCPTLQEWPQIETFSKFECLPLPPNHNWALRLTHAVQQAAHANTAPDDGTGGGRLEDAFGRWSQDAQLRPLVLACRQARLAVTLPVPRASARRARM